MIISIADLQKQINCGSATGEQIAVRLNAIEAVIRRYTNNNFQRRDIRFVASSNGVNLNGIHQYFCVGDTVQISGSVNAGLYIVTEVNAQAISVNKDLQTAEFNLVTKVEYPADVVQCAIDLYQWKQDMGRKVGIKSETLSRHSVTYEDSTTLFMGYPTGILKGLNLYRKARC